MSGYYLYNEFDVKIRPWLQIVTIAANRISSVAIANRIRRHCPGCSCDCSEKTWLRRYHRQTLLSEAVVRVFRQRLLSKAAVSKISMSRPWHSCYRSEKTWFYYHCRQKLLLEAAVKVYRWGLLSKAAIESCCRKLLSVRIRCQGPGAVTAAAKRLGSITITVRSLPEAAVR